MAEFAYLEDLMDEFLRIITNSQSETGLSEREADEKVRICGANVIDPTDGTSTNDRGRDSTTDNVLKGFRCQKDPKKHPKKEYARCWILRRHMKALRKSRTLRRKRMTKASLPLSQLEQAWDIFKRNSPWRALKHLATAKPACGSTRSSGCDQKTYNNTFCKVYFETKWAPESYTAFVDYIFLQGPSELSHQTRLLCCESGQQHTIICRGKWEALQDYFKSFIPNQVPK